MGHLVFLGASLTFLHYFQELKVISIFYKSKMDIYVFWLQLKFIFIYTLILIVCET